MFVYNEKTYENEMNSIARYLRKIFSTLRCPVDSHTSAPSTLCLHDICDKRILCPECLIRDVGHTADHNQHLISINRFIEEVFVTNLQEQTFSQCQMKDIADFYELFWKGLNTAFSDSFTLQAERLKHCLKTVIDALAEVVVKVKTDLLKKYDESLTKYKKVLEHGIKTMQAANEFNINKVVETLLVNMKKGNEKELGKVMHKFYNKKMDITLSQDTIKTFHNYMKMKNNIDFDKFLPTIEFDDMAFVNKTIVSFANSLNWEYKVSPPTEHLGDPKMFAETFNTGQNGPNGKRMGQTGGGHNSTSSYSKINSLAPGNFGQSHLKKTDSFINGPFDEQVDYASKVPHSIPVPGSPNIGMNKNTKSSSRALKRQIETKSRMSEISEKQSADDIDSHNLNNVQDAQANSSTSTPNVLKKRASFRFPLDRNDRSRKSSVFSRKTAGAGDGSKDPRDPANAIQAAIERTETNKSSVNTPKSSAQGDLTPRQGPGSSKGSKSGKNSTSQGGEKKTSKRPKNPSSFKVSVRQGRTVMREGTVSEEMLGQLLGNKFEVEFIKANKQKSYDRASDSEGLRMTLMKKMFPGFEALKRHVVVVNFCTSGAMVGNLGNK